MALSRKEIMLITNKEIAFKEIGMKTDWDNHRKAAERSSWRKKHEPNKIKKCPNRGRRRAKQTEDPDLLPPSTTPSEPLPEPPIVHKKKTTTMMIPENPEEDDDALCFHCQKSSEGYDFQCSHPICHPCFIRLFHENDGHMVCQVCQKEYYFENNLLDDEIVVG